MEPASTLAFPGSRALAGWWRQLQPHQPRRLWVGYLYVHRVEAPVTRARLQPVDRLARLVLQAIALDSGATANGAAHVPTRLASRLPIPEPALRQVLAELAAQGLVAHDGPAGWALTERGGQAARDGAFQEPRQERYVFPFVERPGPAGQRVQPPHYFPLAEAPAAPWAPGDAWRFDSVALRAAFDQADEWKRRFAFPADVTAPEPAEPQYADAWRHVICDRPERLFVALGLGSDPPDLLAFAAQAEGWSLHDRTPVLRAPATSAEALPELRDMPLAAWQQAWAAWCRQRSLPQAEADVCRLEPDGARLIVHAPGRLLRKLEAARSDALRGETALLAGDGYLRALALVELRGGPATAAS